MREYCFSKTTWFFKCSYWGAESRASLSLPYKFFCSSVLILRKKKPTRPNSRLGGVGVSWMLVLQHLFIAQAQERNGRRGGKVCGKKTKAVAGHRYPFPHLSESVELCFPTRRRGHVYCFLTVQRCQKQCLASCWEPAETPNLSSSWRHIRGAVGIFNFTAPSFFFIFSPSLELCGDINGRTLNQTEAQTRAVWFTAFSVMFTGWSTWECGKSLIPSSPHRKVLSALQIKVCFMSTLTRL